MQVFPGELLQYTYRDPENSRRLLGRTEVERRDEYIKLLYKQLGQQHPLVVLVKRCLDDGPSERPSAQELLQRLEGMRVQIEDPYQHLTKLEAMRMLREKDAELNGKDTALREKDAELREKDAALTAAVREKDAALREKDAALRKKDTRIGDLHTQVQVSYQSTSNHELYSSEY